MHIFSQSVKYHPEIQSALVSYCPKFANTIVPILWLEGGLRSDNGLNNRITDRGGLTKFGISQRAYPELDIKALTIKDALSIYYQDYWCRMRCDQFAPSLALVLLDGAINHGVPAMTRILQQATESVVDGLLGPKTLYAAHSLLPSYLIAQMTGLRGYKYTCICLDDPNQKVHLKGWFNRISYITELAYKELLNHG